MMLKKIQQFSFLLLSIVFLNSCGSQISDEEPFENIFDEEPFENIFKISLDGKVIDGYIKEATVCLDTNENNLCDDNEPTTTTDENGSYSLDIDIAQQGYYPLISIGGIDTATNEQFDGTLINVIDIKEDTTLLEDIQLTPLTTIGSIIYKQEIQKDSNFTIDQSKELLAQKLNIPVQDVDKDPLKDKTIFAKTQQIIQSTKLLQKSIQKDQNNTIKNNKSFNHIFTQISLSLQDDNNTQFDVKDIVSKLENTPYENKNIKIDDSLEEFVEGYIDEIEEKSNNIDDLKNLGKLQKGFKNYSDEAKQHIDDNTTNNLSTVLSNFKTIQTKKIVSEANTIPKIAGEVITSIDEGKIYSFIPIAMDEDNDKLTFSITNKPTWASFDKTTGKLEGTPKYTDAGKYEDINISVFDGFDRVSLNPFTITVNNINRLPSFTNTNTISIDENTLDVITLVANDLDGDSITFDINDTTTFTLDGNKITFNTAADFESGITQYKLRATASDGVHQTQQIITIDITNIVEVPSLNNFSTTIDENTSIGTTIGQIPIINTGDSDILSFILNDDTNFEIDASGYIKTKTIFDAQSNLKYDLKVYATSNSGDSEENNVTITINPITNVRFYNLEYGRLVDTDFRDNYIYGDGSDLTTVKLIQTPSFGTLKGHFSALEIPTEKYEEIFTLDTLPTIPLPLSISSYYAYEPNISFYGFDTIKWQGSEDNGATWSDTMTLTIFAKAYNNPPEFDTFTPNVFIDKTDTFIQTIKATDPEKEEIEYLLSDNHDGEYFTINQNGEVYLKDTPNQLKYLLEVIASDGDKNASRNMRVTINNNTPEITNSTYDFAWETVQTKVMEIIAYDIDTQDTLEYFLTGDDADKFKIVKGSSFEEIHSNATLDDTEYSFTLNISDGWETITRDITLLLEYNAYETLPTLLNITKLFDDGYLSTTYTQQHHDVNRNINIRQNANFGIKDITIKNNNIYLGLGGLESKKDGAAVATYNNNDNNISYVGLLDEQGFTNFHSYGSSLAIAGVDPSFGDDWSFGNFYEINTTLNTITKYRNIPEILHGTSTVYNEDHNRLYYTGDSKLYTSDDNAQNWIQNSNIQKAGQMIHINDTLYIRSYGNGIYKSIDQGNSFDMIVPYGEYSSYYQKIQRDWRQIGNNIYIQISREVLLKIDTTDDSYEIIELPFTTYGNHIITHDSNGNIYIVSDKGDLFHTVDFIEFLKIATQADLPLGFNAVTYNPSNNTLFVANLATDIKNEDLTNPNQLIGIDTDKSKANLWRIDIPTDADWLNPINQKPTPTFTTLSVSKDIAVHGVLQATDPEENEDQLSYHKVSDPTHGSITIDSNGSFTYTPDLSYVGNDTFSYKVYDGTDYSDTQEVNITVDDINTPPTIDTQIDDILIKTNDTKTVELNISDINKDTLTLTIESNDTDIAITPNFSNPLTKDDYATALSFDITSGDADGKQVKITIRVDDGEHNDTMEFISTLISDGIIEWKGLTYQTIISPVSGNIWLDRNLGATKVCSENRYDSKFDDDLDTYKQTQEECFGDYYQVGRGADGHEKKDSAITDVLATNVLDVGHGDFIRSDEAQNYDWASTDYNNSIRQQNWNPCPTDFRLPTLDEITSENFANGNEAYERLKIPVTSYRRFNNGDISSSSWDSVRVLSNSIDNNKNTFFGVSFSTSDDNIFSAIARASGYTLRCIHKSSQANYPPEATQTSYTIQEDVPLHGVLEGYDPNNDTLNFFVHTNPLHGELTLESNGSFIYIPNEEYSGSDNFRFKVSDGIFESENKKVDITIEAVNDKPIPTFTRLDVIKDIAVVGELNASDVEQISVQLSYHKVSDPSHGTLVLEEDGDFTYTPEFNYVGHDSFSYKVYDGTDYSDIQEVNITVHDTNTPPTIDTTLISIGKTETKTFHLTIDDINKDDINLTIDSDDTDITITPNFSNPLSKDEYKNVVSFTITSNTEDIKTIKLIATANDTHDSFEKEFFLEVTEIQSDGYGYNILTSPQTGKKWLDRNLGALRVCTTNRNTFESGSSGNNQYIEAEEDCFGDYYQWGRDTDGHEKKDSNITEVLATDVLDVGHGDFIDSGDATDNDWGYTDDMFRDERQQNWNPCPVGYRVPTGQELQDEGVSIPTRAFDRLKIPLSGYRTNAYISEDGAKARLWTTSFMQHIVENYYRIPEGFHVQGTNAGKNYGYLNYGYGIRCIEDSGNHKPTPTTDNFTINETQTKQLVLLVEDLDMPDGWNSSALDRRFYLIDSPSHGNITIGYDGYTTYTVPHGYSGQDSFSYIVNDGIIDSDIHVVNVEVLENEAPTPLTIKFTLNEDSSRVSNLNAVDTETPTEDLKFYLVDSPSHGNITIDTDGSYTYKPYENYHGTDSLSYKVNDGFKDSIIQDINITVKSLNDAPFPTLSEINISKNTSSQNIIEVIDIDEFTNITFELSRSPNHGQITLEQNGSFSYTPDTGYVGSDSFQYEVSDGESSRKVSFFINVLEPKIGQFIAPPIKGLNYKTVTRSGVTDQNGSFLYLDGEDIEFLIGDISFGIVKADRYISPYSYINPDGNISDLESNASKATAISRFLHTLNENNTSEYIKINPLLQNLDVSPYLEDSSNFQNANIFNGRLPSYLNAIETLTNKNYYPISNNTAAFNLEYYVEEFHGNIVTPKVGPLIKTKWGQIEFYNAYTPYDPDESKRTLVGCVAVSLAQILAHHKWPARGYETFSYTHNKYGPLSADFANATYNYDNLPILLEEDNHDIATLMSHAGISVNMDYNTTNSSSNDANARRALLSHFFYSADRQKYRGSGIYEDDEKWHEKLKENLDQNLPVIYSGFSKSGAGHSFLIDGYYYKDDKKLYHVNLGSHGAPTDGWYQLDTMQYSQYQTAVFDIKPRSSYDRELPFAPSEFEARSVTANSVTFNFKDNSIYENGFRIYHDTNLLWEYNGNKLYTNNLGDDITGLTPNTQYTLKVVAYNEFGESEGVFVTFTTLE
jgi:VCBS repeat-containing protein